MLENLNGQQTYTLTVVKSLTVQHRSQLGNSALQKRDLSDFPCPKRISGYPGAQTLWLWPTHSSKFCLPILWTETHIGEMWISQLQLQVRQYSYQRSNRLDAYSFLYNLHACDALNFQVQQKKGHNRKVIQEIKTFECRCLNSHTWILAEAVNEQRSFWVWFCSSLLFQKTH